MRKIGSRYHIFAGLAVVLLGLSVTPYVVNAESGSGQTQTTIKIEDNSSISPKTSDDTTKTAVDVHSGSLHESEVGTGQRRSGTEDKTAIAEQHQAKSEARLADKQLKVCQQREKTITNIMSRLSDRGTKQLDVFGKIAERTEAFYAKSGKTLPNYDALVADVAAKKATAQTTVAAVKDTSTTFNCDGTNPKGIAASFKDKLKAEIATLHEYRTAIKNLIVGVKSVQSTAAPAATTDGSKQ